MANQDDYIKTALRLPRHLHADISVSALNSGRSMNAEIIERLGKSGDLAHLHRVIEQLSDNMRTDREQARALLNHTLMMFDRTVQALDEALLFAQQKNATAADVHRLREEIAHGRSALGALSAANKK